MKKQIAVPGIVCKKCSGKQVLYINTKLIKITELKLICTQCEKEEDILELGDKKYTQSKKEFKRITKEISKTIIKLRETLPKDKSEWGNIVSNPKHPFTAALLSGLVVLMLELSGFGIFMALTWILGNLILNPVGWVLIPVVVGIVFYYRDSFTKNKITDLKEQLKDLEVKRDVGDLSDGEYEEAKDKLLSGYFG